MTATFPISSSAAFGRALVVAALFALPSADAWSAETIVDNGTLEVRKTIVSSGRIVRVAEAP